MVSTRPFHGRSMGSNPIGDAYDKGVLQGAYLRIWRSQICLFDDMAFTNNEKGDPLRVAIS